MNKQKKEHRIENFRISLIDDQTHKHLWVLRFRRKGLFISVISIITVVVAVVFSLIAFTPLRSFIPGYPDAHSKREAISNAIKIDSLESLILKWEFYSENLRKVIDGEDPARIDSLIKGYSADSVSAEDAERFKGKDSLLRKEVMEAERFGVTNQERRMPIEGMHFFPPLKGVVTEDYDRYMHPFIDISAPENTVVTSVLEGTVIGAGWSDDEGYTVTIQHKNDLISVYKHNQKLLVRQGDKVEAGVPIALVGNTGSPTKGSCLHFELWYKGESVNPTKYIKL